jgi:rhodanese-related sulfurtransferase
MSNVEENILKIKDKVTDVIPGLDSHSQQMPVAKAQDLKERLQWGEPALTIIDVRDRDVFNQEHIIGAQSFPLAELPERATESLELDRDIYVYGEDQGQTTDAAGKLRAANFSKVSEIEGGLKAWKEVSGSTEGQML